MAETDVARLVWPLADTELNEWDPERVAGYRGQSIMFRIMHSSDAILLIPSGRT